MSLTCNMLCKTKMSPVLLLYFTKIVTNKSNIDVSYKYFYLCVINKHNIGIAFLDIHSSLSYKYFP